MTFFRLAVLAVLAVVVSAGCPGRNARHPSNTPSFNVDLDRDVNAKVNANLQYGPCGRPKTCLNADVKDAGNTRLSGNVFQALETVGRFGEVLKIVGNRFKPEVFCPPRPASNVDTSAEGILAQRTVRRKPGRSSGKYLCRQAGRRVSVPDDDSGSGSGDGAGSGRGGSGRGGSGYGSGSGSGEYYSGGSGSSEGGHGYGGNLEIDDDVYDGDYGCDKTVGGRRGGHGGYHGGHYKKCRCGCHK